MRIASSIQRCADGPDKAISSMYIEKFKPLAPAKLRRSRHISINVRLQRYVLVGPPCGRCRWKVVSFVSMDATLVPQRRWERKTSNTLFDEVFGKHLFRS